MCTHIHLCTCKNTLSYIYVHITCTEIYAFFLCLDLSTPIYRIKVSVGPGLQIHGTEATSADDCAHGRHH